MKNCSKCKINKDDFLFYKNESKTDGLATECKECNKAYYKKYYENNKEQITKQCNEYYYDNKEQVSLQNKEYQKSNKEEIAAYKKEYFIKNKKRINEYKKKFIKNKRDSEPEFKLISNRRHRRYMILKNKFNSTKDDLGCSPQEWRDYIESKFDSNMNWDNYGSYWELDEIIPCSAWDQSNEIEQIACWNYLNSRPLEKVNNRSRPSARNKDYSKEKQQFLMILRALDIL